ncbi:MAG: alkene reductase, partial [Cyanobacteria bacterium]|nr:alkene reductase [Cyanobacteriota bacterium]
IGNVGYTQESGEAALAENAADLIAYGRPLITNPDLVDRFKNNLPLAGFDDMSSWYSPGAKGYTDFPNYANSKHLVGTH